MRKLDSNIGEVVEIVHYLIDLLPFAHIIEPGLNCLFDLGVVPTLPLTVIAEHRPEQSRPTQRKRPFQPPRARHLSTDPNSAQLKLTRPDLGQTPRVESPKHEDPSNNRISLYRINEWFKIINRQIDIFATEKTVESPMRPLVQCENGRQRDHSTHRR